MRRSRRLSRRRSESKRRASAPELRCEILYAAFQVLAPLAFALGVGLGALGVGLGALGVGLGALGALAVGEPAPRAPSILGQVKSAALGDAPSIEHAAIDGLVAEMNTIESAAELALPELERDRPAERCRTDEQRIEHDELLRAERRVALVNRLVVLVRMGA